MQVLLNVLSFKTSRVSFVLSVLSCEDERMHNGPNINSERRRMYSFFTYIFANHSLENSILNYFKREVESPRREILATDLLLTIFYTKK